MNLSVIIVSYNTVDLLRQCLTSLYEEIREIPSEVFVVDNASIDGSVLMVKEEFPSVKLISNHDNRGFAVANNQALELVKGEYILLLNPDTIVMKSAIQELFAGYATLGRKTGILSSRLLNRDGSEQKSEGRFYNFWHSLINNRAFRLEGKKRSSSTISPIDWAHGAVMFFSKALLDNIGGFDERFFIYAEEIDFFKRAKESGYENYIIESSKVIHVGGQSTRQHRSVMFIENYKSFYKFLKKHYHPFEYHLYRFRSIILALIWFCYYSIALSNDSKAKRRLYRDLVAWHFNPRQAKF